MFTHHMGHRHTHTHMLFETRQDLHAASGIVHAFLRVLTDDFVDGGMFAVRQEFLLFLNIVGFSMSLGSRDEGSCKPTWGDT